MFIWAEVSQDPETVGADLWGEQKEIWDWLRGRLLVLTGVVVDLEEGKLV